MKRDMDLVRKILLAIEAEPGGWAPTSIQIEGYSDSQIGYHIMLLVEAGLLVGIERTHLGSGGPEWMAQYLIWEGHEFLDAARNETTWNRAKSAVASAGGIAFGVLKAVLIGYLTQEASQVLKH